MNQHRIATVIADLSRAAAFLATEIELEEERAGVRDVSDHTYSVLAKSLRTRRDNIEATVASLERVLTKLEAGELQVHVAENGVNGTARGTRRRVRRTPVGPLRAVAIPLLVCVAALASGVVLMLNAVVLAGWFCLGLGAVAALSLLVRR